MWHFLDNFVEVVLNEVLEAQVGTLLRILAVFVMVRLVMNSLPLIKTVFFNIEFDGVVTSSDGLYIVVKLTPNLSDLDVVVVNHGEQSHKHRYCSDYKAKYLNIFELDVCVNARHLHKHNWGVIGRHLALSWSGS